MISEWNNIVISWYTYRLFHVPCCLLSFAKDDNNLLSKAALDRFLASRDGAGNLLVTILNESRKTNRILDRVLEEYESTKIIDANEDGGTIFRPVQSLDGYCEFWYEAPVLRKIRMEGSLKEDTYPINELKNLIKYITNRTLVVSENPRLKFTVLRREDALERYGALLSTTEEKAFEGELGQERVRFVCLIQIVK